MNAVEHFVRLVDVTKRHKHAVVLDAVSLEICQGEFIALLGGSGSGKTTLLRIIAGLDLPETGQVWIDGQLVTDGSRMVVPPDKRQIGFVFQDLALWPHMSIAKSIEFVLSASGFPKEGRKARIAEVLRLTRIARFADRHPGQLSGGEQQRAAIARAIATQPRLLLLDEPMSSLDADLKAELRAELASLQKELGITALYVTHDSMEIVPIVDRIALMRHGKLEVTGSVDLTRRSGPIIGTN